MGLFVKAEKSNKRLKIGLYGISGSGKTLTSLLVATGICAKGKRIALIDTEKKSASMYADTVDFDVVPLDNHHPKEFIRLIKQAEAEGYDVCIVDSLSHEHQGNGGYLDIMADEQTKIRGGNTFAANKVPADLHKKLIDTILSSDMHIICTLRAKKKYVDAVENGRTVKKVLGMEPVIKDGTEFEFDIWAEMDADNNMIVEKARGMMDLKGTVVSKPDKEFGKKLLSYLIQEPIPNHAPSPAPMPVSVSIDTQTQQVNITTDPHKQYWGDSSTQKKPRQPKPTVPIESIPNANDVEPNPLPVGEEPIIEYLDKLKVDDLKAIAKQTGFNQAQFGMVLSSLGVGSIQTIPVKLYNVLAMKFKDKGLLLGL